MSQGEQDRPSSFPPGRHLSEDDSDEGRLHEIIREETERSASSGPARIEREDRSRVQESEDDGAPGLTRTSQDDL